MINTEKIEIEKLVNIIVERLEEGEYGIENETIELKGDWYHRKKNSDWKDEFLKDVCGLANNIEEKKGHLIFGVMENREPYLNDVSVGIDEANIQQIIKSRLNPVPSVGITNIIIKEFKLIVLTVKGSITHLPYEAIKSDGNHYIYIRRGSSTGFCKRQDLLEIFEVKRENQIDVTIEAEALSKLKKICFNIYSQDGEELQSSIDDLWQYSDGYGDRVSLKIINILVDLSQKFKLENDIELANEIKNIASTTLNFVHYVYPKSENFTNRQLEVLKRFTHLGFVIAYNGARRLQSPKVIHAGLELLGKSLRVSKLNDLSNLMEEAEVAFNAIEKWARDKNMNDAIVWTQFMKGEALAIKDENSPEMPKEISEKFMY